MSRKHAFTLPEVLSALAIIGIVALLLLSAIRSDKNTAQLEAAQYDKIQNDVFTASKVVLNIDRKDSLKFGITEDSAALRNSFADRLDIASTWENGSEWPSSDNDALKYIQVDSAKVSGVTLNNGTKIGFVNADDVEDGATGLAERMGWDSENLVGALAIDMNGNGPKNTYSGGGSGDQRILPLYTDGVKQDNQGGTIASATGDGSGSGGSSITEEECISKPSVDLSSIAPGMYKKYLYIDGKCDWYCSDVNGSNTYYEYEGKKYFRSGSSCVPDCLSFLGGTFFEEHPHAVINTNDARCFSCNNKTCEKTGLSVDKNTCECVDMRAECLKLGRIYDELTQECAGCVTTQESCGEAILNETTCKCECPDGGFIADGVCVSACPPNKIANESTNNVCQCEATSSNCTGGEFDSVSCECMCDATKGRVSNDMPNAGAACICQDNASGCDSTGGMYDNLSCQCVCSGNKVAQGYGAGAICGCSITPKECAASNGVLNEMTCECETCPEGTKSNGVNCVVSDEKNDDSGNNGDGDGSGDSSGGTTKPTIGCSNGDIAISSARDLYNVRKNLSASYCLINDINLYSERDKIPNYDAEAGWEPIGTVDVPFEGKFNGNGHTISNLNINRLDADYQGVFGALDGTVLNLGVSGNVRGRSYAGMLAGMALDNSVISHCYSKFTTVSSEYGVGGLVAYNSCNIDHSYAEGSTVMCNDYWSIITGGLVGMNAGSIDNSYANVETLSGGDYIGGLVGMQGFVDDDSGSTFGGSISNSYAIVNNINSNSDGGGYVGGISGSNVSGTIENSYVVINGEMPYSSTGGWFPFYAGSITGYNTGRITSSYAYSSRNKVAGYYNGSILDSTSGHEINPDDYKDGVIIDSRNVSQNVLKTSPVDQLAFSGWDNAIWCFSCSAYPVLKNMPDGAPSALSCEVNSCFNCAMNATVNLADLSCRCNADYYGDGTTSCTACPSGTTSAAGSTTIDECKCPANTYASFSGSGASRTLTCIPCAEHAVSDAGSTSSSKCKCDSGYYGSGSSKCTACPYDMLSSVGSTSISSCNCQPNYYGDVTNGCKACPEHSHTSSSYGTSKIEYCDCDSGYFRHTDEHVCEICPLNYYCVSEKKYECPADRPITTATGKTSDTDCVSCGSINSNKPYWNGTECVACTSPTPVWSGSTCVRCEDTLKPLWDGSACRACPASTPYWDGNSCVQSPAGQQCDANTGACRLTQDTGTCKSGDIAINTVGQLAAIGVDSNFALNDRYCLMKDIDLSGYATSAGWLPIGSSESKPFSGTFDGNGHKLSNLKINRRLSNNQALFGYVSGNVQNLGVEGNVTGLYKISLLASMLMSGGTVSNCFATGQVYAVGTGSGLVATNAGNISLSNAYNVSILPSGPARSAASSSFSAGCFTAYNSGTIERSYAIGCQIDDTGGYFSNQGGMVGYNTGTIKNSYVNDSTIRIKLDTGGFVGSNWSGGKIENCYSATKYTASNSTICAGNGCTPGGFVGQNNGSITSGYYDSSLITGRNGVSYGTGTADVTGYKTEQLYSSPSSVVYTGWSDNIWCFNCSDYPVLKGMPQWAIQKRSANNCETGCFICPNNSTGVYPYCDCSANSDIPAFDTTNDICSRCDSIDVTKAYWDTNKKACVSCSKHDKTKPYWNGNECVSCYSNNASTPYWNGTECVSCAAATDNARPVWSRECPVGTVQNGDNCEKRETYNCKFNIGNLCLVEIANNPVYYEEGNEPENIYNYVLAGDENEDFVAKYNLGTRSGVSRNIYNDEYTDYWAGAMKYCQDKGLRLPTMEELMTIIRAIYGTEYTCNTSCTKFNNSETTTKSCCNYSATDDVVYNMELLDWLGYDDGGEVYLWSSNATSASMAYARYINMDSCSASKVAKKSDYYSALCVATSSENTVVAPVSNTMEYICVSCPEDSTYDAENNTCACSGNNVEYNAELNKCVWHCPEGTTGTHPECTPDGSVDTCEVYDSEVNDCTTCFLKNGASAPVSDGNGGCISCAAYNPTTPDYNESSGTCVSACPTGSVADANGVCKLTGQTEAGYCDNGYIAISTAEELAKIGVDSNYPLNGNYCLMKDISLSAYGESYDDGAGWTPIGSSSQFTGIFDGNGKEISNLYINRNVAKQALFRYIKGASILNLGVTNVNINASYDVAGLVAEDVSGATSTINNCYTTGTVHSTAQRAAGLVVYNRGNIYNSHSSAVVTSDSGSAGGLVLDNYGLIQLCYATGEVTGQSTSQNAGGLVSWNYGTIENSYATGNVTGGYAGGLVAINNNIIRKSFATGNASAAVSGTAGGLVGTNQQGLTNPGAGLIENCYATGNSTHSDYGETGGLVGVLGEKAQIKYSYSTGTATTAKRYCYSNFISGGFIGEKYAKAGAITASYFDKNTSGKTNAYTTTWSRSNSCGVTLVEGGVSTGITGLTTQQLQVSKASRNIYANWDSTVWCFNNGAYPVLKNMPDGAPDASSCGAKTSCGGGSTGTYDECICPLNNGTYSPLINECTYTCPLGTTGTHPACTPDGSVNTCEVYDSEVNDCTTCFLKNGSSAPVSDGNGGCISCEASNSTTPEWDSASGTCVSACPTGSVADANGVCKLTGQTEAGYCDNGYIAISTAEELAKIGVDSNYPLTGNYCLMNDISLSAYGASYNNGEGWEPIGNNSTNNSGTRFTGIFDGNGNEITGLYINRLSSDYQGLFGYTAVKATIKNLGVEGAVSGNNYVGGLVGYNGEGTITNSYATGSVSGNQNTGGLVGYHYFGTIEKSYATVGVTGTTHVGGLVGYIGYATITKSYATGSVSGYESTGGLVGENSQGKITNSYATGKVSGNQNTGGLVGYMNYTSSKLENSYATGIVTGNKYSGGLVGRKESGTITNSYYDMSTTHQSDTGKGVGLTTAQMQTAPNDNVYVGWSSDNWCFSCGDYPVLKNMPKGAPDASACASQCTTCGGGSTGDYPNCTCANGTTDTYFSKPNACLTACPSNSEGTYADACDCSQNPDAPAYHLVKDKNINECTTCGLATDGALPLYNAATKKCEECPAGKVWNTSTQLCDINIDGLCEQGCEWNASANSCDCSNKTCPDKFVLSENVGTCQAGYIAITTAGELAKIGKNDCYPLTGNYCLMKDVSLSAYQSGEGWEPIGDYGNTSFSGTFDGNGKRIYNLKINRPSANYQGLFGYVYGVSSVIQNLGVEGEVKGSGNVGGLVGYQKKGSITNCYSAVSVTGGNNNSYIGGLIGQSGGSITNSYAEGSVTGYMYVGGLVGIINGSSSAIQNCFAKGSVNGYNLVGGLVGSLSSSGARIENSYAIGSVTANYSSPEIGGLIADTGSNSISNSYYNKTTTGQSDTGKGLGLTTAQLQVSKGTQNIYKDWSEDAWCFNDGRYPVLKNMPAGAPSATSCGAKTSCGGGSTGDYDSCTCSGYGVEYDAMINECVGQCPDGAVGEYPQCTATVACEYYDEITNACMTCQEHSIVHNVNEPVFDGSACVSCADYNSATPSWDKDGTGECLPCGTGTMWNAELEKCSACPVGTTENASGVCIVDALICPDGYEYDSENDNCACADDTSGSCSPKSYNCGAGYIAISTAEELAKIGVVNSYPLNGNYCLMNDINLSSYGSNFDGGKGWKPIGSVGAEFRGIFDGNGKEIKNLYINRADGSALSYVGLFGITDSATITNLGISSGTVKGSGYTGGLVGHQSRGTIKNSYTTVDVTSDGSNVGGLVGGMYYGTVEKSYATGDITGNYYAGGLVGTTTSATISNSYATGDVATGSHNWAGGLVAQQGCGTISGSYATGKVSGGSSVGGLVGEIPSSCSQAIITDSYATGNVTGSARVGGLVGAKYTGTVTNTYANGVITSTNSLSGGLIGEAHNGTITNSYYDTTTSGMSDTGKGVGLTTSEMQTAPNDDVYVGWSSDNWCFSCGDYPVLKNMPKGAPDTSACATETTVCQSCPIGAGGTYSPKCTTTSECEVYDGETNTCMSCAESTKYGYNAPLYNGECSPCSSQGLQVWNGVNACTTCALYNSAKPLWDEQGGNPSTNCSACPSGSTWDGSSCKPDIECDANGVCTLNKKMSTCEVGYIAIQTADDMRKIGVDANYPLNGKYCLIKNINVSSGSNWAPIGNETTPFTGVFDGNSKTISGLNIEEDFNGSYRGLFGVLDGATVKKLNLKGDNITGTSYVGGLAGKAASSTIANVKVLDFAGFEAFVDDEEVDLTTVAYAGGLVGYAENTNITSCTVSGGTSVAAEYYSGGLVGYASGGTIDKSAAQVVLVDAYSNAAGGFAGKLENVTVTNSQHTYNGSPWIKAGNYSGGFAGIVSGGSINNSAVYSGEIEVAGNYAGGFAGVVIGDASVTECVVNVYTVNANVYAGGFVGNNKATIKDSYNFADMVTTTGNRAGGFAGTNEGTISMCSASEIKVSGAGNIGGFVGYNSGTVSKSEAFVKTTKGSTNNVGGFVGYNSKNISGSAALSAAVSGKLRIGGFVGNHSAGTIQTSYLTFKNVTGNGIVGGFAGNSAGNIKNSGTYEQSGGVIKNNASSGNISVGGFVGYASGGTIANTYVIPRTVQQYTASGANYVGAFAGNIMGCKVTGSYYWSGVATKFNNGASSYTPNAYGGYANAEFSRSDLWIHSLTAAEMKKFSNFSGWSINAWGQLNETCEFSNDGSYTKCTGGNTYPVPRAVPTIDYDTEF